MRCKNVTKLIPPYLLDELDSASHREVESHISSCPICGGEKERLSTAIFSLKASGMINTSHVRRELTLKAVKESTVQPKIGQRSWLLCVAGNSILASAAVFMIVITAALIFYSTVFHSGRFMLKVEDIKGKVLVQRNNNPLWETLDVGSKVEEGDWLSAGNDALVRFSATNQEGDKHCGNIYANANTSFRLHRDKDRNVSILIESGTLYCQLKSSDSGKYIVIDPENNRITFDKGDIEVGLRYVMNLDAPDIVNIPEKDDTKISFTSARLMEVIAFISKYTGKSIEPASEYVAEKKISFYSNDDEPNALFGRFESYLKEQGLTIVRANNQTFKVIPTVKSGGTLSRRLFARLSDCNATLRSQRGEVTATPREEITIDSYGYYIHKKLSASVELAIWRKIGSQPLLASGKIPMPSLDIKFLEDETTENYQLRYSITEAGFLANIGNSIAEVNIPATVGGYVEDVDESEIVVPVKVRFTARR